MTIRYMDPENGNDANDGLSFANRKRSFGSVTAAVAAGDEVRVIASVDPWSIGNGQWTDNSGNVVLDAAVTLTVENCDTAWTAVAAGVTTSTSVTGRRQGTALTSFAMAATTFVGTAGLVAYKALTAPLDLSAYQCISLLAGWSTAFNGSGGNWILDLCSDAAGTTPLVSFQFPVTDQMSQGANASTTTGILFDNGAALPSGVNSIALRCTTRPVTPANTAFTFQMDNIIATKAPNAANHLSHLSIVGKNTSGEPEWHPIQWIDGVTFNLGSWNDQTLSNGTMKYRGVTEKVTTYAMLGLRVASWVGTAGLGRLWTASKPGTWLLPIRVTGGWDRTAMATQVGQSWFNCKRFWGTALDTNGNNYINLDDGRIGVFGAITAGFAMGASFGIKHVYAGIVDCGSPFTGNAAQIQKRYMDLGNVSWCTTPMSIDYFGGCNSILKVRRIHNCKSTGITASTYGMRRTGGRLLIGSIDNNSSFGVNASTGTTVTLDGTTFKNNSTATASISHACVLTLNRPILGDATLVLPTTSNSGGELRINAANGNRWDNRIYNYGATTLTDQSVVHGVSAQSIKLTLGDYQYSDIDVPARTSLGKIACFAGKTVTFKAWSQRSATAIQHGLSVWAGEVAGIVDTVVNGSAAASTWEQLTISFTPTEDGVVEVFGQAYYPNPGGTTAPTNGASAWFGDLSVSST